MPTVEQERLIARYAEGPDRLEAALNFVPGEALKWRPGPGKWSVHQVVVHCADSEANSAIECATSLARTDHHHRLRPGPVGRCHGHDAHPRYPPSPLSSVRGQRAAAAPTHPGAVGAPGNTYHYEEFAEAEVARGRSLKGLFPAAGEEAKRDYEAWKKRAT